MLEFGQELELEKLGKKLGKLDLGKLGKLEVQVLYEMMLVLQMRIEGAKEK